MAQTEASWCTRWHIAVAEREVSVAIRVAPAWRDVCRVKNVGINKLDLLNQILIELRMPLLDVLAPEIDAFEKFRAFGHFAAVLVHIFLFDKLGERQRATMSEQSEQSKIR